MTLSLAKRTENTELVAGIIYGVSQLDESKKRILDLLPDLEDDEVTQVRMSSRAVGVWSWVIECACDAEILKRIEAPRGRGNKDLDEKGRVAAVNKHAYDVGQSSGTIYRNAQIYNQFKNVLNDQNILEEKGYYEAALRAPKPEEAIEVFAKKKDKKGFFSVRDAHREAEKMKAQATPKPSPIKPSPELQKIHAKAVRAEIEEKIAIIQGWTEPCDPILGRVYQRMIDMLEWQKARDLNKDCEAILKPIQKYGAVGVEDLPVWLDEHGFLMSESDLAERIEYMQRDDVRLLSITDAGKGKQDDRRGKLPQMYVKWFKDWDKYYAKYRSEEDDDE